MSAKVRSPRAGSRKPNSARETRHLHRRQRRLEPLVPHLQTCPINRLLQIFASQHSKRMWHSGLLRRLPNPPRNLVHNHVVMRRVPAQQTSQTNDGVVLSSQSKRPRGRRNLKRPRHPHDRNMFPQRPRPQQSIASTLQKPLRDKRIKPRHYNSEPFPARVRLPLQDRKLRLGHGLNLQCGSLLCARCGEIRRDRQIRGGIFQSEI